MAKGLKGHSNDKDQGPLVALAHKASGRWWNKHPKDLTDRALGVTEWAGT